MPKKSTKLPGHLKRRVVLTGGPAAGKTAVCEVLRRHLANEVAVLPEVATLLFQAGFPRPKDQAGRRLVQQTIYSVQRNLEGIFEITHPDLTHICDRGTLDGGAYWPGGLERFLGAMGTTLEGEYRRYDAVIFLQTSAYGEGAYETESSARIETPAQAR
ncbi:MAG: AAA family ATPase, partial [Planctomycetes bacterium]|nr:AAA family ATPase [Planctomycetota bacterium]